MENNTSQTAGTKKVLIVEDEGEMCLLLNILLNGKNVELDHVKNILAASEYLEKETPAILILDNRLPDGYGVDFISYVKNKYPGIKIIMISGFDNAVQDIALENGADIYLQKPFSKEQLYQSLQKLSNWVFRSLMIDCTVPVFTGTYLLYNCKKESLSQ